MSFNSILEGYTRKKSYYNGETVDIMVNCPLISDIGTHTTKTTTYNLEIYDMNKIKIFSEMNIPGIQQQYTLNSFAEGSNWKVSYKYTIPENLKSGKYIIKMYNTSEKFHMVFVVKNNLTKNEIVVLSNVNTDNSYNYWSGTENKCSLYEWSTSLANTNIVEKYKHPLESKSRYVSFERPDSLVSHKVNSWLVKSLTQAHWDPRNTGEYRLLHWLDEKNYEYDVITDIDLHENPNILNNYKILVLHCHAEYWSKNMLQGLYNFTQNKGNLINLSGNALYWNCTIKNGQMEVRKDGSQHRKKKKKGGLWEDLQDEIYPLPIPEKITGLRFILSSWSILSHRIWGGYRIKQPNHWIFENVNKNYIGEESLNSYSNDSDRQGASGWEYDKVYDPNLQQYIIAQGYIVNKIYNGNDMIYFENNGKIFSTGSVTFTGALPVDNNISTILMNVLNNFLM